MSSSQHSIASNHSGKGTQVIGQHFSSISEPVSSASRNQPVQ